MTGQKIVDEIERVRGEIDDVFQDCCSWLFSNDATITKAQRPSYILASHPRSPIKEDYRDWPKVIEISLSQRDNFVLVHATISEPDENPFVKGTENRRIYWSTFLEELWQNVGVELDRVSLRKLLPVEFFTKEAKKRLYSAIGTISFFFFGVFILFFPPFGKSYIVSGWLIVIACFCLAIVDLIKLRKIKIRFKETYIEVDAPGRFTWVFIVTILVIMPSTIGFLYFGNHGVSTANEYDTYSNFGFSFKHPNDLVFSSKGLKEASSATDFEGMISGEATRGFNQYELIFVIWEGRETYPNVEMMKESIKWDVLELSPINSTMVSKYIVYYRTMRMSINNRIFYGAGGVWYNNQQNRLYWFVYYNTNDISLPIFFKMLETFEYSYVYEPL